MERESPQPLYLAAELRVRDQELLLRYAAEVQPLMARYGGRVIAVSQPAGRVVEGDWAGSLLILHRWESEAAFDAFWSSPEYQPIKALRHRACDTRIVVLPALPEGVPAGLKARHER